MSEQLSSSVELGAGGLCLRVRVPATVVDRTYTASLREMQHKVRVAGYRPGKAPLAVVRRQLGARLGDLVTDKLVIDNSRKAAQAQGMSLDSDLKVQMDTAVEGQAFEFSVLLQGTSPRVESLDPSYNRLELTIPQPIAEEIEAELDGQLELFVAQYTTGITRPASEATAIGDRVTFTCRLADSQQPRPREFEQLRRATVIVGKDNPLPGDLDRSLLSMRSGETRRIARIINREDGWSDQHLRGYKVTFDLTVESVLEVPPCEIDDQLVQEKTEHSSVAEFKRELLRNNLIEEIDGPRGKRRTWLETLVGAALLKKSKIHYHEKMLEQVVKLFSVIDADNAIDNHETKQNIRAHRDAVLFAIFTEVMRREKIEDPRGDTSLASIIQLVTRHLLARANFHLEPYSEEAGENHLLPVAKVINLANYRGLEAVIKPSLAIESLYAVKMTELRYKYSSYRFSEAPLQLGGAQLVVVSAIITRDREPIDEQSLICLPIIVPDQGLEPSKLLSIFIGMRAGESKEIAPPEIEATGEGKIEGFYYLHEVRKLELPTLDDCFAQEFCDLKTLAGLQNDIRHYASIFQSNRLGEQLLEQVVAQSEVEGEVDDDCKLRAVVREIARRENVADIEGISFETQRDMVQEFLFKKATIVDPPDSDPSSTEKT